MTALSHSHGIRCIHMHGWDVNQWCQGCRNHWHHSADDGMSTTDYERESDVALTHAALVAVESGSIPISPLLSEFDLGMAFMERITPQPN
jgi:hypothetical protein